MDPLHIRLAASVSISLSDISRPHSIARVFCCCTSGFNLFASSWILKVSECLELSWAWSSEWREASAPDDISAQFSVEADFEKLVSMQAGVLESFEKIVQSFKQPDLA